MNDNQEEIDMLSKNNFKEKIRQMEEKKERFSIRKLTIGAVSVLLGFTFMGMQAQSAQASQVQENGNSVGVETVKAEQTQDNSENLGGVLNPLIARLLQL